MYNILTSLYSDFGCRPLPIGAFGSFDVASAAGGDQSGFPLVMDSSCLTPFDRFDLFLTLSPMTR